MRNLIVLAVAAAATYYAARAAEVPALEARVRELTRDLEHERLLAAADRRRRHARLFAELPEPHAVQAAFDLGRD